MLCTTLPTGAEQSAAAEGEHSRRLSITRGVAWTDSSFDDSELPAAEQDQQETLPQRRLQRRESSFSNRVNHSASLPRKSERLWGVILTLTTSFIIIYVLVGVINEYVIAPRLSDECTSGTDKIDTQPAIQSPSKEDTESCSWTITNSHPISKLDTENFHLYLGFVLWITTVMAGIGLEILVLVSFLREGWTSKLEVSWRFAQFLFPLLAAATLGLALQRNFMALILLVPGLWKFGFPEAIMYMHAALYKEQKHATGRITHYLNAVGVVVHHGAASMVITMLLSGTATPGSEIVNPILVLLMQHWFVLLNYVSSPLYMILELSLEVWFEWAILSELEALFHNHWTMALAGNCMLVAHWIYLIAAVIDLLMTEKEDRVSEEEDRRTFLKAMWSRRSLSVSRGKLSFGESSRNTGASSQVLQGGDFDETESDPISATFDA